MPRCSTVTALASIGLLSIPAAVAHLDTLAQVENPPPLVQRFEAEACPGVPADLIVQDADATGQKAVRAGISTPVFTLDFGELDRGMYVVYMIAKVTEPDAMVGGLPKPLNIALRITAPDGRQELWGARVAFNDEYNDITHLYFHAVQRGRYSGEIHVDRGSLVTPVVDRIELRDVLHGFARGPIKTRRVLHTDAEIAGMRVAAQREGKLPKPQPRHDWGAEERAARDEILWHAGLPLNANVAQDVYPAIVPAPKDVWQTIERKARQKANLPDIGVWTVEGGRRHDEPWRLLNTTLGLEYTLADFNANRPLPAPWPIPEDKAGYWFDAADWELPAPAYYGLLPGLMNRRYNQVLKELSGGYQARDNLIARYLLASDEAAAADAAFLLAAFAWRYPSYDYLAYADVHVLGKVGKRFVPSHNTGRGTGYAGWSTKAIADVLHAYDILFPYIDGNAALAQRIGRFVPWVKTPQDVIELIDTYFVERAAQDGIEHVLYSAATVNAAVVLGPNAVSEKYLDAYFSRIYLRDMLGGFPDSIINGYSRDGLNYIGSTFYVTGESAGELGTVVTLLNSYVRAGGDPKYNLADTARFPRMMHLPHRFFDLFVCGGYSSNIGDVAGPDAARYTGYSHPKDFPELYRLAWRQQKAPSFAWLLANHIGQGDFTDHEWAEVEQAAATARDPFVHQQSRHLGGFGLAVMEEGGEHPDFRRKNTVTLRTGVASGHAHSDTLDMQFWSQGCRMVTDLGGRVSRAYGKPSCMRTYVHNLVEIDGESFNGGPLNSTGTGWLESFQPAPGAQFTLGSARAEAQPQVRLYRRGVALITVDEGADGQSPNAYVFDVFRVAGGKVHTWSFIGTPPDEFTLNSQTAPAQSALALRYLAEHREGSQLEGVADAIVEATWRLRRTEEKVTFMRGQNEVTLTVNPAEARMLGKDFDLDAPRKFTRVRLFGHAGDKLMVGNWWCDRQGRQFDWPLLYVRQEGDDLQSVWPAVIDAYSGTPQVVSTTSLQARRTDGGAEHAATTGVALLVKTVGGLTDFLFQGARGATYAVQEGRKASGEFAFVRRDAQGLALAHLVGGAELDEGNLAIRAAQALHEGRILSVNYAARQMLVAGRWPVHALPGQELTIRNARHTTNGRVADAAVDGENTRITFEHSADLYQGGIDRITDKGRGILDLPPYLFTYHPDYYNGTTLVNEAGQVLGPLTVHAGDRYMYLGWPEWRRHVQRLQAADLTDADGDGTTVLRMFATARVKRQNDDGTVTEQQPGEHMLDLDITRLSDDGLTVWFKRHPLAHLDAIGQPHPGWPYYQQTLKTEDGATTVVSGYPGETFEVSIDGRPLTMADFPDPDGDGRALVRFYDFGPGDTVSLPAAVYLKRRAEGGYDLRTNVQASVTVDGKEIGGK